MSATLALLVVAIAAIIQTSAASLTPEKVQVKAARDVISRVLGSASGEILPAISLSIDGNVGKATDIFTVSTTSTVEAGAVTTTTVHIVGTSGVALTSGFYHYLRNYCNGSFSWGLNRTGVALGAASKQPLPLVPGEDRVESTSALRYMYNYCTLSYSLAFSSEADWVDQVDWLALHGINLPLAAVGYEHVQATMYKRLGLTEQEMLDFFPGAGFLSWNRMSDMDGPWSGPLTADWRLRRAQIGNATYQKMRDLGMMPVLQAFGGHVPCQLKRIYPNISLAPRQHWNGFNSSCLLDPKDPLFKSLAANFMKTQVEIFGDWGAGKGTPSYYATDQWNEINPSVYEASYLKSMSAAVYDAMAAVDPDAVWVMQAWFLVRIAQCEQGLTSSCGDGWLANRSATPPYPLAEAYLSGVPKGRLLLLDLEADTYPVYKYTDAFYGHDFIWSVIHNFGQKPGVFGNLTSMAVGPVEARADAPSNFKGIGLAMEGINQNFVIYELATEMAWHGEGTGEWPLGDLKTWAQKYRVSRYGGGTIDGPSREAWELLTDASRGGVYMNDLSNGVAVAGVVDGGCDLRFSADASNPLPVMSAPGHNATNMAAIFDRLLAEAVLEGDRLTPALRHDLVDIARQTLDNLLWDASRVLEAAFHRRDSNSTKAMGAAWKQLATDLDTVLGCDQNFMVGPWIAAARATAQGEPAEDNLEYNARNQITLWGPKQASLSDYARKMWHGLLKTYHLDGRWGITIDAALSALSPSASTPYDPVAVRAAIDEHELAWQTDFKTKFPTSPSDSPLETISSAKQKYANELPTHGYDVLADSSTTDEWHLLAQPTWTKWLGSVSFLCDTEPSCAGFTSDGWLIQAAIGSQVFDRARDVVRSTGVDLYLKQD